MRFYKCIGCEESMEIPDYPHNVSMCERCVSEKRITECELKHPGCEPGVAQIRLEEWECPEMEGAVACDNCYAVRLGLIN